ncbi:MAG: transglutaminase domain-containing protein [Gammaproteobacteria bacterium]
MTLNLSIMPGLLAAAALLAAGCTTRLPVDDPLLQPQAISPQRLLAGAPLTGGVEPNSVPLADILGLNDEMRRFVTDHVPAESGSQWRLRALLRALLEDAGYTIEYEDRTYTAAEAFRLRRANCLGFTNMFVALAREAGLTVHFQEVDVPPDWSQNAAGLVQSRHVNTLVVAEDGSERVVDFNMADFRTSYDRRMISDARAAAHFYNNDGVDRMAAGDRLAALQYFRMAIDADGSFAPVWINLGALYSRAGYPAWAEAAWLHTLTLAPHEYVAMSNLERLYRDAGRSAAADKLAARIKHFRNANPYYRYQLAEQAFSRGDYRKAIAHLRFAVQKKPNEDRFYALMGLAWLREGDADRAQRWMARAEAVAQDDELKNHYHGKLERLRSSQVGRESLGS